uniref:Carbohydrate ABC transporter ATP-binding protein, CUT1 family n=1 Tax=Candidatus Kentrum sp. DK TaxID=2126562 RepID=A0A450SNE1_9GAMM|nr:MAG: carbohydrate ABC transporter ATP-binding protein, CUT1 family [Candidatus Kentron sp. DK]
MSLKVVGIRKNFAGKEILKGVDLTVEKGECMVLLGSSGCGKTTLLRVIAGLDEPDDGSISVSDKPLSGVPARKRNVALVFQDYSLYSHRRVFENIAYPLRLRGTTKADIERQVQDVMKLLGIENLSARYPASLSGGEQQRVALGRALVRRPDIFLLDEPLSSLDRLLRDSMRNELREVYRRLQIPIIHVTHDQEEALLLGNRIAVFDEGKIVQCDYPATLLNAPRNKFVAGFVGNPQMNFVTARVRKNDDKFKLELGNNGFAVTLGTDQLKNIEENTLVLCGFRPWAASIKDNGLQSRVTARWLAPPFVRLELQTVDRTGNNVQLSVLVNEPCSASEGDNITLALDARGIICFDLNSGLRISNAVD